MKIEALKIHAAGLATVQPLYFSLSVKLSVKLPAQGLKRSEK
jgi:hypothetical protein